MIGKDVQSHHIIVIRKSYKLVQRKNYMQIHHVQKIHHVHV